MTDVDRFWDRARSHLAEGRFDDALAAFDAARVACGWTPTDPRRIALAGEHGEALFRHREDADAALAVATPTYEAAAEAIDDAREHPDAVRELWVLRDRMTFWAFHS